VAAGAGEDPLASPGALAELERRLGHAFSDPGRLRRALTHPSWASDAGSVDDHYQRLEFLGDAVLDLAVSELLIERHPDANEGQLSIARAAAVSQRALAERARALGLERLVRLGRGERRARGAHKPSILSDAFEAVLGALYLDGGYAAARAFVEREVGPHLAEPGSLLLDAKSRLAQLMHTRGEPEPTYALVATHGPPHEPRFEAEVRIAGAAVARGWGGSKQAAEQEAASVALDRLAARPS